MKPGASLAWELNNLVFSNSDSTKLPGSFSFPFEFPNTQRNQQLLGYPSRIDNADTFLVDGAIEFTFDASVLFRGTLRLISASSQSVRASVIVNPLSTLKTVPLNTLDMGGDRTFASEAALLSHAKDTTTDPLDYDYIFFPVYNLAFLDHETSEKQRWMNWYNAETPAFEPSTDAPGFMPFVRLEYVLEQMFAEEAYTFVNAWQTTDELRNIVLYNHKSLFNDGALETTFDLQSHVPKDKSTDVLRKIMGLFCLGLFYNPWAKVLRLVPLRDLITKAPAHNWTAKLVSEMVIRHDHSDVPEIFQYEPLEDDAIVERYTKKNRPDTIIDTVDNMALLDATIIGGVYYVKSEHSYWLRFIGGGGSPRGFLWSDFLPAPSEAGSPVFESDLQPLYDIQVPFIHGKATADSWMLRAPVIEQSGTITYDWTPSGGSPETYEQTNDNPLRLTIYRGLKSGSPYAGYSDYDIPFASASPYRPGAGTLGEVSLRWEGTYGLYEKWWKGWNNMQRTGKTVSASLLLTIPDLLNFSFDQKVRIQNQDFLITKIRVNLTPAGLAPVEVEMVSVI